MHHQRFQTSNLSGLNSEEDSGPVHTYPDIFENAFFFIRFQKESRPHEERFRKYPRPHEDAATLKTSLFELRQKKTDNQNALLLSPKIRAHARYVVNQCLDISVFEKLRFHPSTRQHENGVFKKIHSGERFRKDSFLVTENAASVWTLAQNG